MSLPSYAAKWGSTTDWNNKADRAIASKFAKFFPVIKGMIALYDWAAPAASAPTPAQGSSGASAASLAELMTIANSMLALGAAADIQSMGIAAWSATDLEDNEGALPYTLSKVKELKLLADTIESDVGHLRFWTTLLGQAMGYYSFDQAGIDLYDEDVSEDRIAGDGPIVTLHKGGVFDSNYVPVFNPHFFTYLDGNGEARSIADLFVSVLASLNLRS